MTKPKNYKKTLIACYLGFVTQAISSNFTPLLFLTFRSTYGITLEKIALIPFVFYFTQLLTDLAAARFVDKIGYRPLVVTAHFLCAAGLSLLGVLPYIMAPYIGLIIATVLSAVGGGLIEVIVSPIIEACPSDNKASAMSLLHSFYCWGQMAVVLVSTLVFRFAGIGSWRAVAVFWALIPFVNAFLYMRVPINALPGGEGHSGLFSMFKNKTFVVFLLFTNTASQLFFRYRVGLGSFL